MNKNAIEIVSLPVNLEDENQILKLVFNFKNNTELIIKNKNFNYTDATYECCSQFLNKNGIEQILLNSIWDSDDDKYIKTKVGKLTFITEEIQHLLLDKELKESVNKIASLLNISYEGYAMKKEEFRLHIAYDGKNNKLLNSLDVYINDEIIYSEKDINLIQANKSQYDVEFVINYKNSMKLSTIGKTIFTLQTSILLKYFLLISTHQDRDGILRTVDINDYKNIEDDYKEIINGFFKDENRIVLCYYIIEECIKKGNNSHIYFKKLKRFYTDYIIKDKYTKINTKKEAGIHGML
jgi:hypothetical protein